MEEHFKLMNRVEMEMLTTMMIMMIVMMTTRMMTLFVVPLTDNERLQNSDVKLFIYCWIIVGLGLQGIAD